MDAGADAGGLDGRKEPMSSLRKSPGALRLATPLAAGTAGFVALSAIAFAVSPDDDNPAVPTANTKSAGFAPATRLAARLLGRPVANLPVAQGSTGIENPTAPPVAGDPVIRWYGYVDNGPMIPATGSNVEATKTEPDKNTYLVLRNLHGADAAYNYGTHFLFQGHENGKNGRAGFTRINLDADADHRVTLIAVQDKNGAGLPTIDGSTWDPFAKVLLFTSESAA